ncbi:response regulator [Oculatella sp. LEGE 06141]|uniref:response regulator n=1 Tax=Oculatella sp. LEGE 06141 TaxID=1828648 RepID=UPI0018816EF6|nr:response regulator [Oculatella sp. LEGE 06141]MBE9180337.1 response regulator [Oculatella sp. LEGE 06141]
MRILVVDDDELLAQQFAAHLKTQHYVVDIATDGETGWDYARSAIYDLIVLDINLPKLNGLGLCQKLRQSSYRKPILLLTAMGESSDKVMGLDAGADDYVVKPCSIEELGARVRALLRRQTASGTPILEWGHLCLDPSTCDVTYQNQPLALSPKEYALLELFLRNPQRIFSSSLILEHLWGFEDSPGEEAVRTHIKRLRRRLKLGGAEDVIETIYGMGYRLKPPVEPQPSLSDQARAAAIEAWEHLKKPILARLTVLDQATMALQRGHLPEPLRDEAEQAAHKLAGSLGMFGFPEGSRLGWEIEQILKQPNAADALARLEARVVGLHQELQKPPTPMSGGLFSDPDEEMSHSRAALVLLIVDSDAALIQQLQHMASQTEIHIETALTGSEARIKMAQQPPDVVLLDLAFSPEPDAGLELLEELGDRLPQIPVLVFTKSDRLGDRLRAARCSNHWFISKTTPLNHVLQAVQDALNYTAPDSITVLIVDDDPVMLHHLKQCLPRWGICPITLNDAGLFWETLETVTPDLLILAVEMPIISGIELCQVVRSDYHWHKLPILFLSAHHNAETIHQVYSAGADDYVAKPFTETELVTRIFNRLKRNQRLSTLAGINH